jgi:hypothetical protein
MSDEAEPAAMTPAVTGGPAPSEGGSPPAEVIRLPPPARCYHCGYALGGHPEASPCPECGKPGVDAWAGLEMAPPAAIEDLAAALRRLIGGVGVGIAAFVVLVVMAAGSSRDGPNPLILAFVVIGAALVTASAMGALRRGLAGASHPRAPARLVTPPSPALPLRLTVWYVGGLCVCGVGVAVALAAAGPGFERSAATLALLFGATAVLWASRNVSVCVRLRWVARRCRARGTARALSIAGAIVGVWGLAAGLLSVLGVAAVADPSGSRRLGDPVLLIAVGVCYGGVLVLMVAWMIALTVGAGLLLARVANVGRADPPA